MALHAMVPLSPIVIIAELFKENEISSSDPIVS
jgi:hypothetical protein